MITWLFAIVYVEAITEIFVEAEIFQWFRDVLKRSKFFGALISCGYCFSVWAAAPIAWALPGTIFGEANILPSWVVFFLDWICKIFILHRLSNIFHEALSRWFGRNPFVLVLSQVNNEEGKMAPLEVDENESEEDRGS